MKEDEAFFELGPVRHTLVLTGIYTVEQLAGRSARELVRLGIATAQVKRIETFLAARGLALEPTVERRVEASPSANLGRRAGDRRKPPRR